MNKEHYFKCELNVRTNDDVWPFVVELHCDEWLVGTGGQSIEQAMDRLAKAFPKKFHELTTPIS